MATNKRKFLTEHFKIEDILKEVSLVLMDGREYGGRMALNPEVGEYLRGAGVAVAQKRGSSYQTPLYYLSTNENGHLSQKAMAWLSIYGLEKEAAAYNMAQVNRWVERTLEDIDARRRVLLDELKALDADKAVVRGKRMIDLSQL